MSKYKWKSQEAYKKAYQWVMSEQARLTKGKTISNAKKSKLFDKLWKKAEQKFNK